MFEKIGRLAEAAASSVGESRRGFLGRLGQGALATVALFGGVLVSPAAAQSGGVVCCKYQCADYTKGHYTIVSCQAAGTTCAFLNSCDKPRQHTAATCAKC